MTVTRPAGSVRAYRLHLAHTLRLEARSRDTTVTTLTVGLLVALVGNVAYADRVPSTLAVPGVVWTAVAFAAQVGLARTFIVDRERGTWEAMLASPSPPFAYFAAKLTANLLVLVAVALVVFAGTTLFMPLDVPLDAMPWLVAVVALGAIGIATVTTLAAAMALHGRHWVLLVPLLSLPALFPVLATGVPATQLLVGAGDPATALAAVVEALRVLAAFDVVFLTAGWMLAPFLLEP